MKPEDFCDVEEFASCVNLNRKTVYDMINAGKLKGAQRFGRVIRIHKPTMLASFADVELPVRKRRPSR